MKRHARTPPISRSSSIGRRALVTDRTRSSRNGGQVQGPVRRRLGRTASEDLQPPEGAWLDSSDAELTPRANRCLHGTAFPRRSVHSSEDDGSLCGFVEHADVQAGRLIDGLDELGIRDNTIVIYIWETTVPVPKAGRHHQRVAGAEPNPNTVTSRSTR